MHKVKLNLCSIGDPTNPRTWSGTPYHLYSELKRMDCLASAFDSEVIKNPFLWKCMNRLGSLFCDMDSTFRYLNVKKVKKKTALSTSQSTLHTGTLDLPFYRLPENQSHYLFCDSTWNLFSTYSTQLRNSDKKYRNTENLEQAAYLQMKHIFPISEYVKKNLIDHYGIHPEKITVVGTGLGIIKPYFEKKNYANHTILFVAKGRFEDKGGPLVLEAFRIAVQKNPALQLIIVGQNEYTKKIHLPNVKTYGFIPIEELQAIFNESSLFLMPAHNEPWGLVYLEALACRMPIVGLNRNSFPELSGYGQYGFGLDNADPAGLSEILLDAFRNPQGLAEIGEKGQKYCLDTFSWTNTVSKIVQTIERIEEKATDIQFGYIMK